MKLTQITQFITERTVMSRTNFVKVVSIVFAIVVWFYIKAEQTVPLTKIASIEIAVAEGMAVLDKSVEKIVLELEGNEDDIAELINKEIKATVDVQKYEKKSVVSVPLNKSHFNHLQHITVTNISPPSIEITIDKLVERVLPVEVPLSGEIDADHTIRKMYTNPKQVKVKGPQSVVEELKTIKTEPVDVTGRIGAFSEIVPLESLFPEEEQKLISVHFLIDETLTERTFSNVPVAVLTAPSQHLTVTLLSAQVNVIITGSKEAIEKITANDIKPFISVVGLSSGSYELPVQAIQIKEINLVGIEPKIIEVTIGADLAIKKEV